jgi:hypothetical protein
MKFKLFIETQDKLLIIMRGSPGSGKSHKAKQLVGNGMIFSTDDFWGETPEAYKKNVKIAQDENRFMDTLIKYHQMNYERSVDAMKKGISPIVIDNTNIKKEYYQRYLDAAKIYGYRVEYHESDHEEWKKIRPFIPHDKEKIEKAAEFFHKNNSHDVPKETIIDMLSSFEEGTLKDMLKPVPQSPKWHKEGDVFKHTQLVRKGMEVAISLLKDASQDPNSAFSNLDMNLAASDVNMLKLGGWLHDIGKRSATTIGDKPWNPDGPNDLSQKINAIGHEDEEHFEPMMQKLGKPWQNMYQKSDLSDKNDLWYMIRNHMSLNDLWSKRLWLDLIDENGKYKNERKVKLLLILVLMDKMGRYGEESPQFGLANGIQALRKMQNTADLVLKNNQKTQKAKQEFATPQDFIAYLKAKGVDQKVIDTSVKNKFGQL